MICFESRRRLLGQPRERTPELGEHLQSCGICSRLEHELAAMDRSIRKATRISVPDGLADRILLARASPARLRWTAGIAAAATVAGIALLPILPTAFDRESTAQADAVGPGHPAVAAISMVVDREPELLKEHQTADSTAVQERLRFVGLSLKSDRVSARYVGKCQVAGRECEHLVLATPEGHTSVFLIAHEYYPAERILVADRRMTALLSPAPAGAYILVGQSPKAVRRAQKLLVHG